MNEIDMGKVYLKDMFGHKWNLQMAIENGFVTMRCNHCKYETNDKLEYDNHECCKQKLDKGNSKYCGECHEIKHIDDFHIDNSSHSGKIKRVHKCIDCYKKKNRESYRKSKEKKEQEREIKAFQEQFEGHKNMIREGKGIRISGCGKNVCFDKEGNRINEYLYHSYYECPMLDGKFCGYCD